MPKARLTKRLIDGLIAGPQDCIYWDTNPRGFGCKARRLARKFSSSNIGLRLIPIAWFCSPLCPAGRTVGFHDRAIAVWVSFMRPRFGKTLGRFGLSTSRSNTAPNGVGQRGFPR